MLTKDQVALALPPHLRKAATQEFVDKLNNITSDPVAAEHIRDNFISYTHVLQQGKFRTTDYLNAVTYVSFKLMGLSNREAYGKTFPDRIDELLARGATEKEISSYVSIYNKGKLVNLILEQTLIPIWVLNQDAVQKAINTQVDIMQNSNNDMARTHAANSLLNHLKKPEAVGPLVNINMQETSGMKELKSMIADLAEKQREAIKSGVSPKTIAEQQIIDVETE